MNLVSQILDPTRRVADIGADLIDSLLVPSRRIWRFSIYSLHGEWRKIPNPNDIASVMRMGAPDTDQRYPAPARKTP